MFGFDFSFWIIIALILLIALSVPVVIALGLTSFFGLYYITGNINVPLSLLNNTAYGAIRDYIFAVIPLFVLMGELISRSGAAEDLYNLINKSLKKIPARLALATVFGNAVFGAVTGVSIASAAAFSKIAYPQMVKFNYNKTIAVGCIAGSASLGMLIPPSILMIVWGVLTEQSIGKLFIAGIIPGIILSFLFAIFCFVLAYFKPDLFGQGSENKSLDVSLTKRQYWGAIGVSFLIVLVLGGIWFGFFTPTEAAGIGALFALILAILKGVSFKEILDSVLETGKISAPILLILICAQMYSRLLAMGGITDALTNVFTSIGGNKFLILFIMVAVWFILGMFIDSVSIILLTVPIFAPIAYKLLGYDPISFAIIGILAIEAGLLTPPLGLCVYTVKGCIVDPDITLGRIFYGSVPYWILLLVLAILVMMYPGIANWLPAVMTKS
ncbi:MAG: TRAP transporter large permease [Candidatus Fonsibacter sp.]|nr:TRAP transporter large permease [Candidatus Fonsibacter sp.]